ncbi:hypothetical protein ACS0TY_004047 [Phlomoides rotata]
MTVERFHVGGKKVLVGIRLDAQAKELLDWAVVKVADPGDTVVAIHVCRNSDCISKEKALLDGYLKDYEGLCSRKQVALNAEVLKGNSIRKALVREAKNHSASVVIVGIARYSALGGWASISKYCAKKLPLATEVMAVYNGKVVFSRCSKHLLEGPGFDPKPSFYDTLSLKDNRSEFGESEISEMSRLSFDGRENITSRDDVISPIGMHKKSSFRSISLPAEDFTKQRPGWPLLQTTSSVNQLSQEARKMSVVQWVMTLPNRASSSDASESNSPMSCKTVDSLEFFSPKLAEMSTISEVASTEALPKDLELILMRNPAGCKIFSHDFLKMSTNEFSSGNLIGKGGCNSVYKGIFPEGKAVAVKILESSKEAWKDFIHEVDIMTTLKHKRIAPLLGICVEDNNHLISVYDLMSKGNLEDNLHGGNRKENSVLSWETRFQIAVGIAEALNYLHSECPKTIIHRDIKSSNILLTDELEPQLSDFGMAIWGPTTSSFLMDSDVVGTFGYLAPEYFMYGKVSDKIDIYAFGVVLLELLSGRKPIGAEATKGQESLVLWAKPRLESTDLKSIVDPDLDENINEAQMQRMVLAAALCLTQAARLRPKMCQILNILRGEEYMDGSKPKCGNIDDQEIEDGNDDEVYPDSSAESHLSLAFLDVYENTSSPSSLDQSSPLSVEEYLKKRWSRSFS